MSLARCPSSFPRSPSPAPAVRFAVLLAFSLALFSTFGCQSEEEKLQALLESGRDYAAAGQHSEAAIEFRQALQIDPNRPEAHYELAQSYASLGKTKEAYWEFSESVRLAPSNHEARLKLGALALVAKDFEVALEQAERAAELQPDEPAAQILLGQAQNALGRPEEAEAAYLKAIELKPDFAPYYLILGRYYGSVGDRESAEPALVKYTELDPTHFSYTVLARFLASDPARDADAQSAFEKALEYAKADATVEQQVDVYLKTARFHFGRDRMDETVRVLQSGIEALADNTDAKLDLVYSLARFYVRNGDTAASTALLEQTAEEHPDHADPHAILAGNLARRGKLEEALAEIDRALAIEPESTPSQLRKAELLVDTGVRNGDSDRIAEGTALVDSVLAREPTNLDALLVKGKVHLARKEPNLAAEALLAGIDVRPEWPETHYLLARALMESGDLTRARGEAARAVELDLSMLDARRLLAGLHASLGEYEYAVEQGRIYLSAAPDDAKTRVLVAQSLVQIGRPDEAMQEISQIPEEKRDSQLRYALGGLYLAAGQLDRAREELLRANEETPNHAEILGQLLRVEDRQGRLADSEARIAAAVLASPGSSELMRLKGVVALRKGDVEAAEEALRRATELDPKNLAAYQQLARIYEASGRVDDALGTYERALAEKPDSAQLHYFVGMLSEMQGDAGRARREYERAIELDGGMAEPKNNLAYILAESGEDLDRALDLAQAAKAAMPDSATAADTLGWVLYKRGIGAAAVGYLKEAIAGLEKDSPDRGPVHQHLALAYEATDQKELAIESLEQSLAELKESQERIRSEGGTPEDPAWAAASRELLAKLAP